MQDNRSDIQLFNESGMDIPVDINTIKTGASLVAKHESCKVSLLEVVYVDEAEIIKLNKKYLDRDYITDIITFRYDENSSNNHIEGTLFCCAQRIYEQALEHDTDSGKEFQRILIHGLLHLCGYKDDSPKSKMEMTARENFYLDFL